jgi:hypothetical protein
MKHADAPAQLGRKYLKIPSKPAISTKTPGPITGRFPTPGALSSFFSKDRARTGGDNLTSTIFPGAATLVLVFSIFLGGAVSLAEAKRLDICYGTVLKFLIIALAPPFDDR